MFMPIAALIAKTFMFTLPPAALDLGLMLDVALPVPFYPNDMVDPAFVFDWSANGRLGDSDMQGLDMQTALDQAKHINHGASWICSPSGFGKKSRCYPG